MLIFLYYKFNCISKSYFNWNNPNVSLFHSMFSVLYIKCPHKLQSEADGCDSVNTPLDFFINFNENSFYFSWLSKKWCMEQSVRSYMPKFEQIANVCVFAILEHFMCQCCSKEDWPIIKKLVKLEIAVKTVANNSVEQDEYRWKLVPVNLILTVLCILK